MIVVMTECDEKTDTDPLLLPIDQDQGTEKNDIKTEIVNGKDQYQERGAPIVGPKMDIEIFKGITFDEIDTETFKIEIAI